MFLDEVVAQLENARSLVLNVRAEIHDQVHKSLEHCAVMSRRHPWFKCDDMLLTWADHHIPSSVVLNRLPFPYVSVDLGMLREHCYDRDGNLDRAKSDLREIGRACMFLEQVGDEGTLCEFWIQHTAYQAYTGMRFGVALEDGHSTALVPQEHDRTVVAMLMPDKALHFEALPSSSTLDKMIEELAASASGFMKLCMVHKDVIWVPVVQPPKLQKARAKVGKKPLGDYHTVKLSATLQQMWHEKHEVSSTHASPDPHWRRAHWKIRKTGAFFWHAHIVNAERGLAKKQVYQLEGGLADGNQ